MDEILQNHRKELKVLQAEIQKLKKSVSKGDKKRLKEVQMIIFNLEKDMNDRHKKELEAFELSNNVQSLDLNSEDSIITEKSEEKKAKKKKKKNNEKVYSEVIKRLEENEQNTDNYKELEVIKKKLSDRNLKFVDIPPDGNCLFNAIGYQCAINNIFDLSTEFNKNEEMSLHLRQLVYQEMMLKKELYSAFVSTEDSSEFDTYCELMRSTRAWGGQLEINALSEILKCTIEIIQAGVPSIVIGEHNGSPRLIITYHKFAYGLGEHYNTCDKFDE